MSKRPVHLAGPEHYRLAEWLAGSALLDGTHPDGSPIVRCDEMESIALAQVHATLALAAAVAGLDAIEGPAGDSATGRLAEDGRGREPAGPVRCCDHCWDDPPAGHVCPRCGREATTSA
jgi:hypothetical protein